MLQKFKNYFTLTEKVIWGVSFVLIVGAFVLFDRSGVVTMLASLVGLFSCFREKKSTEKKKYKGDTFALE